MTSSSSILSLLPTAFISLNILTIILLIGLNIYIFLADNFSNSNSYGDDDNYNNNNGSNDREREEELEKLGIVEMGKVYFSMWWLILVTFAVTMLSCLTFYPSKFFPSLPDISASLKGGMLEGSALLYGNMLLMLSLYLSTFTKHEEIDENDNNGQQQQQNNDGQYYYEDDYNPYSFVRPLSIACLVLGLLYALVSSFMMYTSHRNRPMTMHAQEQSSQNANNITSVTVSNIFRDIMNLVSILSILFTILAFTIVIILPLFPNRQNFDDENNGNNNNNNNNNNNREDEEHGMEKGTFIVIMIWLFLLILMCTVGLGSLRLFGSVSSSNSVLPTQYDTGLFIGCLLGLSLLEFLLGVLYGSFHIDYNSDERERGGNDMYRRYTEQCQREYNCTLTNSISFSFICLFMSIVHFFTSIGMYRYSNFFSQQQQNDNKQPQQKSLQSIQSDDDDNFPSSELCSTSYYQMDKTGNDEVIAYNGKEVL